MTEAADIEAKFWKALKSDRTFMLGLAGHDDLQPMTAIVEEEGHGCEARPQCAEKLFDVDMRLCGGRGITRDAPKQIQRLSAATRCVAHDEAQEPRR